MKRITFFIVLLMVISCSSNVKFIQTDDNYELRAKPEGSEIVIAPKKLNRPHIPIGIIEVTLDKRARKLEFTRLMTEKAREIGVDAVMMVKYDVDKDVYIDRYAKVVGKGPWRHRVFRTKRRVKVNKIATGIAVVFE